MNPFISIIIRTKNEERYFGKVLEIITHQTYTNFEILIVDDNSTDTTLLIAQQYHCKIIVVPKGMFTHPFSCNLGAQAATGDLLVYLNGHSIPISSTWLADGIKNFADEKVAGVYAAPLANPDANYLEKFLYAAFNFFRRKRFAVTTADDVVMGVLGTTNAIIRKGLWEQYHFNEAFEMGGEDGDWAKYWVGRGYKVVHDPLFKVYHSHNLGLVGQIKQYLGWRKMGQPRRFRAQENRFK